MSAVIAHLAKRENLTPPLTGQVFVHGWFLNQSQENIAGLDVPEEWKSELTSVEDNAHAAIIQKSTIPAMIGELETNLVG